MNPMDSITAKDRPARIVARGNAKLGRGVWHVNLPAGDACPGASEYCSDVCYAKRGFYTLQRARYGSMLDWLRDEPDAYALQVIGEVAALKAGAVFRFHTSGDIDSVTHVDVIRRIVESRPDVTFYLYTRSWRIPEIREAIERDLFGRANLYVWASTDPTTGDAPDGWRDARIVDDVDAARADRRPVCPEQTGRRASCSDCGLCWSAKDGARLAFIEH